MSIDSIIQSVSVLVAVLTFAITHFVSEARDRATANRETYQRLELASIDLFRFEADHMEIIRPVWEDRVPVPPPGTAEHTAVVNYVCQILNLFEMAIRLRKEGVVPPEVFGSWVIWYYNLANAPHFGEIWDEVQYDYTFELRQIMNVGVFLAETESDEEARVDKFFASVARGLKCKKIRKWTEQVRKEREKAANPHPKKTAGGRTVSPAVAPEIAWCADGGQAGVLARFMAGNIDPVYISHGELQDGRALDPQRWSPGLEGILAEEMSAFMSHPASEPPGGRVAVARIAGAVVAVLLVEVFRDGPVCYAVLHDLVVDRGLRGQGIGALCLAWAERQLGQEWAGRIFLESGTENHRAHAFFSRAGFRQCSLVMFKDIP